MEDNYISQHHFINNAPDHYIWIPIRDNEIDHYMMLITLCREAMLTGTKKEKGDTLETLMTFVYERFNNVAEVTPNTNHGDNQIDHILEFYDGLAPIFIHNYIGMRIIGESKNHNKSIGVREVADLNELLRYKRANLGIFSSFKTFSRGHNGSPWQYAEGKRRKLSLSRNTFIIGFTLDELESLTKNNFYTLLKHKFFNLIDEIDDDYTEENFRLTYHEKLYHSLLQLFKNEIINEEQFILAREEIIKKYGFLEKV